MNWDRIFQTWMVAVAILVVTKVLTSLLIKTQEQMTEQWKTVLVDVKRVAVNPVDDSDEIVRMEMRDPEPPPVHPWDAWGADVTADSTDTDLPDLERPMWASIRPGDRIVPEPDMTGEEL